MSPGWISSNGMESLPLAYTEIMAGQKKTAAAKAAEYSSLALVLPVCTFVGYGIGYWLDERFGTTWLSILFLILGAAAGFIALIRQIMVDSRNDGA